VLLIQTKDEENTDLQLLLPNIKRHVDTCTYQSAFSGFVFGLYLPLFLWVYSSLVLSMAESRHVWIPQKTWTWLPLWQINSHYSERYSRNKELFTGLSMMLHPQDRSSVNVGLTWPFQQTRVSHLSSFSTSLYMCSLGWDEDPESSALVYNSTSRMMLIISCRAPGGHTGRFLAPTK